MKPRLIRSLGLLAQALEGMMLGAITTDAAVVRMNWRRDNFIYSGGAGIGGLTMEGVKIQLWHVKLKEDSNFAMSRIRLKPSDFSTAPYEGIDQKGIWRRDLAR